MWRERQQHTCGYVNLSVDRNVNCRWMGPVRSAHCVSSDGTFWPARVSDGLVSRVMSGRWIDSSKFFAIQIQPALFIMKKRSVSPLLRTRYQVADAGTPPTTDESAPVPGPRTPK